MSPMRLTFARRCSGRSNQPQEHRGELMMNIAKVPKRPLISASILSADFAVLKQECRDVLDRGVDMLHLDVMDGHFVPNLTLGPDICKALRKHFPEVFLDTHLMVEHPENFFQAFADAGASLISFHAEVCEPMRPGGTDADALIDRIHDLGMAAGMVINPGTPAEALEPWLAKLDLALVMSVEPGYSGQAFKPEVLTKAKWLAQRLGPGTRLEMDGGLNGLTAVQAAAAGVDVMVSASALFGADDRSAVVHDLHNAATGCMTAYAAFCGGRGHHQ